MDTVWQVVAAFLLWVLVRYILYPVTWRILNNFALRHVPTEGPMNLIDGHLSHIGKLGNDIPRWTKWLKKHRRILRCRLLYITEINLIHPETAAIVLKTATPKAVETYAWLRAWIGDGLLISSGKQWARDRRLLTNGFHFGILRGYLPIYKEAVGVMLGQWSEAQRREDGRQTVEISKCSKLLTLDIILRCIMSFSSDCQLPNVDEDNELVKYAAAVQELGRCLFYRTVTGWQYSDILFALSANGKKFFALKKYCCGISARVIRERRQTIAELVGETAGTGDDLTERLGQSTKHLDFLDILLTVKDENGEGLSDKEIQEQVDTFLFEGHDTTASALQWTLYYLAKYPDFQEKCRQEVMECLGDAEEPSYENLSQLAYLAQFIKESMRLSATVPFIARTLTQPTVVDGHTLPTGTMATIPIIALHRNPDVWPDPETFDPDRFTLENCASRHPFAFIPFSAGPRNCIGQTLAMDELKTVLAMVLSQFRISLDPSDPDPVLTCELVSRSLNKMHVCIERV